MAEFFDVFFGSFFGSSFVRSNLQSTWLVILLIAALVWGGGPEKVVIGVWILVSQLSPSIRRILQSEMTTDEKYLSVNGVSLAVDLFMLVAFVALAFQANRQYLLWVAALQVIAVLGHVVRATTEELTIFVYLVMITGAGWLQLFVMTAGQIAHMRRERGVYPDWRWQVARPGTSG